MSVATLPGVRSGSLVRLRDVYRGRRAAVVFGGPSLIERAFDFRTLRHSDFVLFIDTKVLTPHFLSFGIEPDFFILSFPERCKGHSLHHFIYRSFLADFNLGPCLKRQFRPIYEQMREEFDRYFEPWRAQKGPHKRFKWRANVYLPGSPCDLLSHRPRMPLIANRRLVGDWFPEAPWTNPVYWYEQEDDTSAFDVAQYYAPVDDGERLILRYNPFLNSAAIALYPLLGWMGFEEVYLLGMDMSMLGSMEYAAPYTFQSMLHFRWFFSRTSHVFNADYRMNRPFYLRPRSEFDDARAVLTSGPTRFIRVADPHRHVANIESIPTISTKELLHL